MYILQGYKFILTTILIKTFYANTSINIERGVVLFHENAGGNILISSIHCLIKKSCKGQGKELRTNPDSNIIMHFVFYLF